MGAQQSQTFGYEVGPQTGGGFSDAPVWSLHEGTRKADGMKVSVFVFDVQKQPALADVARNTLKRLKTLRHPSLVTYLDGLELPTTFYMVTERVTPLRDALPDIKTNEHHLSWGLCQVLKGLQFLNGDCQLVHGNVTLSSIFVSKAGDWKLGGLEFVSSPSESAPALKQQLELVDSRYHSPEVKRDAAAALQKMAPHAIDMYMYGCLLYEVFNGPLKSQEDLVKPRNMPQSLAPQYRSLVSTPKGRPEPAQLVATCKYFSNPLVDALQFLENIALKDSHEKDTFFGKLGNQIDHFPKQLCTQKILPSLVTALDYGYANSRALGPLLKIGSQLPPDDYAARITPSVVKWFGSTDREMRTNLLSNIESFAEHLTPSLINDKIYTNLALGFSDLSPKLRELTIRSIVVLAPKLSSGIINTEVLRHFARLQLDKEPYIRTNTTICLGRIAKHLAPATRKKVLASAFARSLRDPFPPARVAGLMAFTATHEYYDAEEVAKKVLPCLSMLAVDIEKQVRTAALQGLRLFLEKLEKHSELMVSSSAGTDPAGGDHSAASAMPGAAGGEGILGWALGSISKKIYGDGSAEGHHGGEASKGGAPLPASAAATTPGGGGASLATARPPAAQPPAASAGGWSDAEDDDLPDDDWGTTTASATRTTSAASAATKPAPSTGGGSRLSTAANAQDAGGWGDDDDWAKEDSDDGGWGNDDDDDWGGVPRAHEEDEADVFAPPKKQPVASPLRPAATPGVKGATTGSATVTSARPSAVAPTSPSAEKKGIPGLRRAEAATATAKPFSSASSSSFSGVAAKPAAASATATAISSRASSSTRSFSLAAAKKVEPATAAAAAAAAASPARSYSSPTGKSSGGNAWGASDDEEEEGKGAGGWGDDGWGDAAGDGGDDDGWDFPAAASPSAARKNTGGGPSPSSPSAPATGLSKLEQRALLRNQKKNTGKKD